MEPKILKLVAEVPTDFRPTFEHVKSGERIVGTLDDLCADVRRAVTATYFLIGRLDAVTTAHEEEHARPDYTPNVEACMMVHREISRLTDGVQTLALMVMSEIPKAFTFGTSAAGFDFRAEGIVEVPAELADRNLSGLAHLIEIFGDNVTVLELGADGITDLTARLRRKE